MGRAFEEAYDSRARTVPLETAALGTSALELWASPWYVSGEAVAFEGVPAIPISRTMAVASVSPTRPKRRPAAHRPALRQFFEDMAILPECGGPIDFGLDQCTPCAIGDPVVI
jgi:hypothetical protein